MNLGTPESAIISAIVFNALIIPLLVPLALRGVRYRPVGATALLRRNLLIYGLGGLIAPFIGIKLIDLARPQPARRLRAAPIGRMIRPWSEPVAAATRSSSGMAAGVGKTYRMLQEGQAEAAAGRDVVIGYLEPHGRAETAAQAEGLEQLPRRRVDLPRHRARGDGPAGDLPARARAGLIDELAHTNAPGARARASATRTSTTCSTPASTSSRPSTSSTSRASTTRSPS